MMDRFDIDFIIGNQGTGISLCKNMFHDTFTVLSTKVKKFGRFYYQTGSVTRYLKRDWDVFFIQAHFRYLDFWLVALLNFFFNKKVIFHGQGLYRYNEPSLIRKLIYSFVVRSSYKYLCYNKYCHDDLIKKIGENKKITWANNFIRVNPEGATQTTSPQTKDILFIGRIRERNGLEDFLDEFVSYKYLKEVCIHIIGGGTDLERLTKKYFNEPRVIFHGMLVNDQDINLISSFCKFGIYPGDAGLSVLHYASLGLIPIFHSDYSNHMGPEFSYFSEHFSSITYNRSDYKDAIKKIMAINSNSELNGSVFFDIYKNVEVHSFGRVFHDIVS